MDEHNNNLDEHIIVPETNDVANSNTTEKKGKTRKLNTKNLTKRALQLGAIIFAVYLAYSMVYVMFSPDRNIRQIYLVPEDAAFIIETADPINDWHKFNQSETWQCLKQIKSIEEITQTVEYADSLIHHNKTLLSLVGKRDMIISLHKTRTTDWDFLTIVDMQKASKMEMLKDQIETIFKLTGSTVTQRAYSGVTIHEIRDPETRDILFMAFVDNHVVLSYNSRLLESSIDSRKTPKIGLNHSFIEAEKLVANKGLARLYINYANLPQFMSIYLGGKNEYLNMLSNSMDFAGLYLHTDKNKIEVKGYTFPKEVADPYVSALLNSGKHKMKAHEIMSARTALYTNIGFDNPTNFIKELEQSLSESDKAAYDNYQSARKKIESLFGISLDENFLSWMSGEFAISQAEPGLLGSEPEFVLAVRAKSIKSAQQNMDIIEKKVKSRTPIRIKTVEYKGFDIKYLEMKGFFRLFFGKLFDKFEKPYYTYVDDYVVFSNKSSSLLSFIEDYKQKNLLKNDPGFKRAYAHFQSNSTVCIYTDVQKFYPQLKPLFNAATWKDMQTNTNVFHSFPYWNMQIVSNKNQVSLHYVMDYNPYVEETDEVIDENIDKEDKALNEEASTEKELMSELKRFYVEKFEGNILRDFYPEGALKSESEVKEGKRHGRYREYYEDGKLKARGKYAKGRPKGTWKYYTEEGKFDKKEKF